MKKLLILFIVLFTFNHAIADDMKKKIIYGDSKISTTLNKETKNSQKNNNLNIKKNIEQNKKSNAFITSYPESHY